MTIVRGFIHSSLNYFCETSMKTNRKCPEYWGMPHHQTFGVMEFFGMLVLFWVFFPLMGRTVAPPIIMERFRIKILAYKAFCYCNMEAFLRKELFSRSSPSKTNDLYDMANIFWELVLATSWPDPECRCPEEF